MPLAVEIAGQSDVGCLRSNNEDNFGYDLRYGICVVCDGMGGQAAGEVASKMAVDAMLAYFRDSRNHPAKGTPALEQAIQHANREIYEAGTAQESRSGMGSTIVAALVHDRQATIANVGDSRIYLIRAGGIEQLTQDHSLVMEQVRRGYITREEAENSNMQNVILRALGSEEHVEADLEDIPLMQDDVLLLASDGLTRHVKDPEILEIVQSSGSLRHACGRMIDRAKERGGDDNITCLLLQIVKQPWYKSLFSRLFSGGAQWQNSI